MSSWLAYINYKKAAPGGYAKRIINSPSGDTNSVAQEKEKINLSDINETEVLSSRNPLYLQGTLLKTSIYRIPSKKDIVKLSGLDGL